MIRKFLLAAILALGVSPALAQNPTCPTRPFGDNTNACASTAFVQSAGIGGSGVVVQPTIAALRASTPGPTTIFVQGFYTPGDGGGGVYIYYASSALADNNGSVIAPNIGSGRWILDSNNIYTPEQFGSKHTSTTVTDGSASSTTLTSATANFTSSMVGYSITINGAGTSGAQLRTTIQAVNSSTSVTLAAAAATTVSGATVQFAYDDAPAIRAALCAISSNNVGNCSSSTSGVGKLQLGPYTYNLASFASGACYTVGGTIQYCTTMLPFPNVEVVGTGAASILRLVNGMTTWAVQNSGVGVFPRVFSGQDQAGLSFIDNRVGFRDFTIDFNGTQNSCGGTCWANIYGINIQKGDDIVVQRVGFLNNPGANDIVIGGLFSVTDITAVSVVDTYHNGVANNTAVGGYDYSAVNVIGQNVAIIGNRFENGPAAVNGNGTAIEVHGYNQTITANVITGYTNSMIAGNAPSTTPITGTQVISSNVMRNVNGGIQISQQNAGGGGTDNITVSNNAITFTPGLTKVASCIDANSLLASPPTIVHISMNITSNQCFMPGPVTTTDITPMIAAGGYSNLTITGNSIFNSYGPCFETGYVGQDGGAWTISNNQCFNPGLGGAGAKIAIQMDTTGTLNSATISGNNAIAAATFIAGTMNVASNQGLVFGNSALGATINGFSGTGWFVGATCSSGVPTSSFFTTQGVVGHC